MGLFDFRKQKPEPPPEVEGPSPHYAFAHLALPSIAFDDPLLFLGMVASPEAEQFFDAVLKDVAEHCRRDAPFDATAIRVHPFRSDDHFYAVLELPEPQEMAEAYMVAFVVPNREPDNGVQGNRCGRYFTLEKGFQLSGEPRTVLGEWNREGHANYGDGPDVSVGAFVEAIRGRVQAGSPPARPQ